MFSQLPGAENLPRPSVGGLEETTNLLPPPNWFHRHPSATTNLLPPTQLVPQTQVQNLQVVQNPNEQHGFSDGVSADELRSQSWTCLPGEINLQMNRQINPSLTL